MTPHLTHLGSHKLTKFFFVERITNLVFLLIKSTINGADVKGSFRPAEQKTFLGANSVRQDGLHIKSH